MNWFDRVATGFSGLVVVGAMVGAVLALMVRAALVAGNAEQSSRSYDIICFNSHGETAYVQTGTNLKVDGSALHFTIPAGDRIIINGLCFAAETNR